MIKLYRLIFFFTFLYSSFLSHSSYSQDTLTLADDRLKLIEFFNSTNGNNWTNKTNWGSADVTTWYGVTVSGGRVTALNIHENNLTGSLPSSISRLTALADLDLLRNAISGSLPPEIGDMAELVSIRLDENDFTGSLPSTLGNLTNLAYLSLAGNKFSGAVPTQFNNLDALLTLNLQNNDFTDLPDLTGMSSLTGLYLYSNRLTFQDIIPNVGIPGIGYSNMKAIPLTGSRSVTLGDPIALSIALSEPGNTVKWLHNFIDIPGQTGTTLSIASATGADAGRYKVEIRNSAAPNLVLYGGEDFVNEVVVTVYSPDAPDEAGYAIDKKISGKDLGLFEVYPGLTEANNNVIYTRDVLRDRMMKLTSAGAFVHSIDFLGSGPGKLGCLSDMAVDAADAIYISSECGDKVVKYNASGNHVYDITGTNGAYGIAIDTNGDLLVLSRTILNMRRYNSTTGALIETFNLTGAPEVFGLDLEVDSNGDYVVMNPSLPAMYKFSKTTKALVSNINLAAAPASVAQWSGWHFALGTNNDIYLGLSTGKVVQVSSSGTYIRTISYPNLVSSGSTHTSPTRNNQGIIVGDFTLGLQLFALNGTFIKTIGPTRNANGQFFAPREAAIDSHGNRYVCDYYNGRVEKFNSKGVFVQHIGSLGTGAAQLRYPNSIAINDEDILFVADVDNHRIQKYDASGAHLGSIGSNGTATGKFCFPMSVAISKRGYIYVADTVNHRIQKFSREGNYISSFGSKAEFGLYRYLAVENDGNILVAYADGLKRYDENGQLLSTLKLSGIGSATDIAADNFGYFYVTSGNTVFDGKAYKYDKLGGLVTTIDSAAFVSPNAAGDTLWVSGAPNRVTIYHPNFKTPAASDRDILVQLYDATNGPSWNRRAGWKTAASLETWEGVTVSAGKVVRVDLNDNGLDGTIPASLTNLRTLTDLDLGNNNLEGELPATLNELTVLQTLNVADNQLTGIIPQLPLQLVKGNFQNNLFTGLAAVPPFMTTVDLSNNDLSSLGNFVGSSLQVLEVDNNQLSFQDLAQNIGVGNYDYLDQDSIGVAKLGLLEVGKDTTITVTAPGAGNVYKWKRNDAYIPGATSASYVINDIGRSNMGEYMAEVTNPVLPGLTLRTRIQDVWAYANLSGRVFVDESIGAEDGTVVLFTVRPEDGYIQSAPVDILPAEAPADKGKYEFKKVILDDYMIRAFADTLDHPKAIPTYYPSSIYWEEADTLIINEHRVGLDIVSGFKPSPPKDGSGFITGTFYEDVEDEGGRTEGRTPVSKAGASVRRVQSSGRTEEDVYELIDYVLTNKDGEFTFSNLEEGTYWLNLQYPGYPMDSTSYMEITVGTSLKERGVIVEADVLDNLIFVRQMIILGWDEENISLGAYPNPASTQLFIKGLKENGVSILVSDTQGKLQYCPASFDREGMAWMVNVASLKRGLYLVKVNSKEGIRTLKIAIE